MTMDYDVLVVGSGIGGMESALKLGDMGYNVLLVEKEASVGGKMILLSKVFPTLDCASCISTPKMASTIHHPNITVMTYSEVNGIQPEADGRFRASIRQKARYVVHLAEAALDGRFDPGAVAAAADDEARARLTALLGVGRWTADIYLLMALGRPDVWPDGDLALAAAMRRAKGLDALPDVAGQRRVADAWRPWRAVAARLLWHAYLAGER